MTILKLNLPSKLQSSDAVVDLEGGPELEAEAGDDVAPLHDQHRAPVQLLQQHSRVNIVSNILIYIFLYLIKKYFRVCFLNAILNQILRDPRCGPGRDVGDRLVDRQLLPVRRGERGQPRGAEGHLEAAVLPAGAGAGGQGRQLHLEMLLQRQLGLGLGGGLRLVSGPGAGRRHEAGVAGAGGALPAALRLGGDGRLVALHVVAEVARVAEEHLLLHTARYRTAALSRVVTVATHVVPGLVADEAGLAVDALPRLGVDLVRQVLGVVEAAGVDCGEWSVRHSTRTIQLYTRALNKGSRRFYSPLLGPSPG